ncbi:hypothetical protein ACFU93_27100 [Streptomyces sp. NPDC057611]|uniref:hypothetical protein n=1 Tax=Streptomyces sp. NPDC057611 TaxID=3346182 RepID=UPI00368F23A6
MGHSHRRRRAASGVAGQKAASWSAVLTVILTLLIDQNSAADITGGIFAQDQAEFFDLILELGDYTATCSATRSREQVSRTRWPTLTRCFKRSSAPEPGTRARNLADE